MKFSLTPIAFFLLFFSIPFTSQATEEFNHEEKNQLRDLLAKVDFKLQVDHVVVISDLNYDSKNLPTTTNNQQNFNKVMTWLGEFEEKEEISIHSGKVPAAIVDFLDYLQERNQFEDNQRAEKLLSWIVQGRYASRVCDIQELYRMPAYMFSPKTAPQIISPYPSLSVIKTLFPEAVAKKQKEATSVEDEVLEEEKMMGDENV